METEGDYEVPHQNPGKFRGVHVARYFVMQLLVSVVPTKGMCVRYLHIKTQCDRLDGIAGWVYFDNSTTSGKIVRYTLARIIILPGSSVHNETNASVANFNLLFACFNGHVEKRGRSVMQKCVCLKCIASNHQFHI